MRSPGRRHGPGIARVPLVALVALALVAAACSSDSSDDSSDSPDSSEAASGATTTGAAATTTAAGDDLDAARDRLAPWLEGTSRQPPADGPAAVAGMDVYVVSCGEMLESCSVLVDGVMEAADAIGWKATLFDTQLNFPSAGDAVRQAMAAGADGAVVVGVDCQHFAGALDEAKTADFPVVVLNAFDCDVTSDGEEAPRFAAQVDFTAGDQDPIDGAKAFAGAKADWAAIETEGDLRVVNLQQDDLLAAKLLGEGFAEGVARCASCEIAETVEFSTSDLLDGTFAQKLASALVQHPEANAVSFPFGATVVLGLAALTDAGRDDLLVLGAEGMPSQYQLLADGTIDMVMAFSAPWAGWATIDTLNRVFAGAEQVDEGVGYQLLTAGDLDGATEWDVPDDYRGAYREVWGVG